MADNSSPNQNADKTRKPATSAAEQNEVPSNYDDTNNDDAGGITNRSYNEERQNQESLPTRGSGRDERRSPGVGDEVEAGREERRSER